MKFQVYRTHASSYQDSKYLANEKKILEDISDVEYIQTLQQYEPGRKLILLTNTHTNTELIPRRILQVTVLLVHPNSGHDNLSDEFRKSVDFPIIVGNPIRANAVAEYTLASIFQHFSLIPNHHHWQADRNFPRKLLRDQNIVLIGHGTIGRILASSLYPLCPKLQVYDPFKDPQHIPYPVTNDWNSEIIKGANIVIIAASLNDSSHKFLNSEKISQVAGDCLIVNPARGEIVDEEALLQFLQKNPKSRAFLDVFEREPFEPGYAGQISNLNKTSHIAGMYHKLNSDIVSFEYLVIKDFVEKYKQNSLASFKTDYEECLLLGENIDGDKVSPSS